MKLAVQICLVSLLSLASAVPVAEAELDERQGGPPGGGPPAGCHGPPISQSQANTLVARYSAVIAQQNSDLGTPTQTAEQIVDAFYSEQSDSANIQLGIPLGALTTASKQKFISESQSNPPLIANTLGVYPSGCTNVLWQWRSTKFGSAVYEVQGFHLFNLDSRGLINKTYFEFNSIAGALDIGFTVYNQQGTKLTPSNV